ncbi:hypothetical protein CFI14_02155 [Lactiplantibacillus pentosus]|uniref:hypothetical protein n=1 Tax=Lactiplantibacillus pentosus TaxID=1589 RepID=UPI000EA83D96|nr:hypothetical protein [Lactiplantibacillus pentosus]AYG37342.1 hypothetical protein CFK27_05010 [Lactiplantibacillus pentosus]AYG39998.1 hypothetical protein CFI14_02155 [Lactiplantibacillus pentosus]MCJ8179706.1 hypothetical protein [Lactiplantibacillus pentosus]
MIAVSNTFKEIDRRVTFADPIKFQSYTKGAQVDTERCGIKEVTRIEIGKNEFIDCHFRMRRMGTVTSRKTAKLVSVCIKKVPLTSSIKKFTGHMLGAGVIAVVMTLVGCPQT